MQRALWCTLIAILAVMGLAACGSNKSPEVATAKATANLSQTATAVPSAKTAATKAPAVVPTTSDESQAPEDTAEPEPAADDSLNLESRDEGLDRLKSYRMSWVAEWSGTDDGKAESGAWRWVEEYSSDPKALHWKWDVQEPGKPESSSNMEMWQIGNTTYITTTAGDCMSMSSDDTSNQLKKGSMFNPSSLGRVQDAKYTGDETVNGVPAKHYKYDENAADVLGFGQASGEIWVAIDGGFVVKEITSWKGGAGIFGAGANAGTKGEGHWTWELSDVDRPIDIQAPTNCGGATGDMPILPDATEKNTFGDMMTYSTPSTVEDATAFYQREMEAAGWTVDGEPTIMEGTAILSYTKGDQKAQIMISKSDDKTSVIITISK